MKKLLSPKPWLVLFDIDDTLVVRIGDKPIGLVRWSNALQQVYGISVPINHHTNYSGWVDYQIGWDLASEFGISHAEYVKKFPRLKEALYIQAIAQSKNGQKFYQAIDATVSLAQKLKNQTNIFPALLTGNLEKVGWWKLEQAGILDIFSFGMFADEAKVRVDIAKQTFDKALLQTGIKFQSDQITVIGDTVHDIACGKSIDAYTIGYTVGRLGAMETLKNAGADIVVDSLMDAKVLTWFQIA